MQPMAIKQHKPLSLPLFIVYSLGEWKIWQSVMIFCPLMSPVLQIWNACATQHPAFHYHMLLQMNKKSTIKHNGCVNECHLKAAYIKSLFLDLFSTATDVAYKVDMLTD